MSHTFKVGDTVRILRLHPDPKNVGVTEGMESTVGEVATVVNTFSTIEPIVKLQLDDGGSWWYDTDWLEPVAAPMSVQPSETADSSQETKWRFSNFRMSEHFPWDKD